jgi:hypothetical protein
MPKRLHPILGLMVVCLGLNQSAALAYESCIPPAPSEALQMADVVFAGKAIEANQQAWRISHVKFAWRPPFLHLTEDHDRYRSTFEVTMVWKGEVAARTTIIHSIASCGASYSFRQGEEFIVYAKWFEGELYNAWCHRNNPLSAASEDLSAFGAGKPPVPIPSSLADLTRRLTILFLFLALLGWAIQRLRRKYGVRNHEQTHSTC